MFRVPYQTKPDIGPSLPGQFAVGFFYDKDAQGVAHLWLIDLDDTLIEASAGMLYSIHVRMDTFITRRLGLSGEEATVLRAKYWEKYGTTFLGLWRRHGVDPREFLTETHDFDPSPYIRYDGCPATDIACLSGKKVLFTNGPRIYAERVIDVLGVRHVLDGIVTSTDMLALGEWHPKPSGLMLKTVCRRYGVTPGKAVLVDDSLLNLRCARQNGLKTVWCTGYRRRHGKLSAVAERHCVDHAVRHIRELSRLTV